MILLMTPWITLWIVFVAVVSILTMIRIRHKYKTIYVLVLSPVSASVAVGVIAVIYFLLMFGISKHNYLVYPYWIIPLMLVSWLIGFTVCLVVGAIARYLEYRK